MSRILGIFVPAAVSISAIACLVIAASSGASAQTIRQILNNGPRANRFNIVILSEGYTSAELSTKFQADAQRILNTLFQAQPYKEYQPFFNAYTIAVASAESGSDHPSVNVHHNTYFNSTYDSFGVARLLTIPPNDIDPNYDDGQGKVDALLTSLLPEYDFVFMVVNDPGYGGSGGQVSITSLDPSASEILIHESGHTIAGLGDEYDTVTPGYGGIETPNTTQQTTRSLIKWHNWINAATPIPTPETSMFGGVIGLFEGAAYNSVGWYRPKLDCRMNHLGVAFCEICSEALVLSFEDNLSLIDDFSPAQSVFSVQKPERIDFRVASLVASTHSPVVRWFVDSTVVSGANSYTFSLSSGLISAGRHTVAVEVRDATAFVRTDPTHILVRTHSWEIYVTSRADFNADGKSDILWQNSSGARAIWLMNGTSLSSSVAWGRWPRRGTLWVLGISMGTGRRTFSGKTVLARAIWLMNGTTHSSSVSLGTVPTSWNIVGSGDFNGDAKADILGKQFWGARHLADERHHSQRQCLGTLATSWGIVGSGDFNGDGKANILWQNSSGWRAPFGL